MKNDDSLTRVELARLEGTVSALTTELRGLKNDIILRLDDHEIRIRTVSGVAVQVAELETWRKTVDRWRNAVDRWRYSLPATALIAVAGLVTAVLNHR